MFGIKLKKNWKVIVDFLPPYGKPEIVFVGAAGQLVTIILGIALFINIVEATRMTLTIEGASIIGWIAGAIGKF